MEREGGRETGREGKRERSREGRGERETGGGRAEKESLISSLLYMYLLIPHPHTANCRWSDLLPEWLPGSWRPSQHSLDSW